MIWNYSVEEIVRGYGEEKEAYRCVICGEQFSKGRIYQLEGGLYDACGAVKKHVETAHGPMVDYLLGLELSVTGISPVQQQVLGLMAEGRSDREIGEQVGIAQSTVRNHRFKLREKEKQAKMFLALMEALADKTDSPINVSDTGIIEEVPAAAAMVDERYSITAQEREKTIQTYMDENGALKQIPAKAKKKIILLGEIVKNFKRDTEYSEKEINTVLKRIYEPDYLSLRRALIEYGFMDRSADCRVYRVKE